MDHPFCIANQNFLLKNEFMHTSILNVKLLSKFKIQWQEIVQERKGQIYFIISYSMPPNYKKKVIFFKFHNYDYVHKWIQQKRNKPYLRNFTFFWADEPASLYPSKQFGINILLAYLLFLIPISNIRFPTSLTLDSEFAIVFTRQENANQYSTICFQRH